VRVTVTGELPGVVNGEVRRAEALQLLVRGPDAPATPMPIQLLAYFYSFLSSLGTSSPGQLCYLEGNRVDYYIQQDIFIYIYVYM
jgi:hypothetical protein